MPGGRMRARQALTALPSTSVAPPLTVPLQPTVTIALSTTFTPPASCTANNITILPPPGYYMWANEPVPFTSKTFSDCYPSEFLKSYTSVEAGVSGSSIVPVMSPLVCPHNFCTASVADNYIVCCPSGYQFAQPTTNPVIADRPGYGGTCYSDFTVSSTLTAIKYASDGSTGTEPWVATKSGIQAFAHPIDGFAAGSPLVGCPAHMISSSIGNNSTSSGLSSSVSSSSSAATTESSNASKGVSGGTIAGAVVGSVIGLAAIIAIVFILLRRRRKSHKRMESSQEIHQMEDDFANRPHEKGTDNPRYEKDSGVIAAAEVGASNGVRKYRHSGEVHELDGDGAHELPAWRNSTAGEDNKNQHDVLTQGEDNLKNQHDSLKQ